MKTLLGYIGRDKHADSLVEKLMLRFETAATPAQWRNLAFCLTQVPHHLSPPVNTSSREMHKHHHRLLLTAAGYLKRVASTHHGCMQILQDVICPLFGCSEGG